MADVFISYSSKDFDYAERLHQYLTSSGISAWYAPYKIKAGSNFASNIGNILASESSLESEAAARKAHSENLSECQILLLLLSKNSMKSPWVSREVIVSIDSGKFILPLRIDNESLTEEYKYHLAGVQIIPAYHLMGDSLQRAVDEIWKHLKRQSPIPPPQKHDLLLYSDLNMKRIAHGDPYYQDGTTLKIHLSEHCFFLMPPKDAYTEEEAEWVQKHFAKSEVCFDTSLPQILREIPIEDLEKRIHNSQIKVFEDFLFQTNGCYFNNKKYGVEQIRPFGRTEDMREIPELQMSLYTTDYYTHRVMKDVCKTLIAEKGEEFLSQIVYTDIGPYAIFFTSLGLNLLLLEHHHNGEFSVLLAGRSTNAAETYGENYYASSVIEGVSLYDYDPSEQDVRISLTLERGLKEELGVKYTMIQPSTIRFYDLFVNLANLEMGLSASVELAQGISLDKDIQKLRGKDDALEISGKHIIPVQSLNRFILNNRNRLLPQAAYTLSSYLESIGIFVLSRYAGDFSKEQSHVMSKDGHSKICGDTIVESGHYIAVVDGATPKGELLWDGKAGDVYVAQLLADAIKEMPYNFTALEAISFLNSKIQDCYVRMGRENIPTEERLQASVVLFSAYRREIWSFGDCKFRINQMNYDKNKKVDILLGNLRAFCMEVQKQNCRESGAAYDPNLGRERILPFLKNQTLLANTEWSFGYDVLDGGKIFPEHVSVYAVQKGDHVVLSSDGYPVLFDTLEDTEEYLRKTLKKDSECIYELRGTKGVAAGNESFDDRSYISFIVK